MHATTQKEPEATALGDGSLIASLTGDRATTDAWRQFAVEEGALRTANLTHEPGDQLIVDRHVVNQQGDQVVVNLVMHTQYRAQAYRQTRFYRRTAGGWVRTDPDAALWGPEHSLETPSFIFHFRQNDAAAVIAVAPQIEDLYTTLRRNFGLPLTPDAEKLVIDVNVTQPPGGDVAPWFHPSDRFIIASPALYLAPVEMTDAELLAQSIVLPLLAHVLAQASERYAIGQP